MLSALRIESFAIIDALEIRFGEGLNVLTGETGAGKSILFDALGLLLGGRADPRMIRAGAEEAVVEGIFVGAEYAERARALGLPAEGPELLVRRVVARGGKGRVYVNGSLATVGMLSDLLGGTVDLSGQHEHLSLLRKECHGDLLDRFGGLGERVAAFGEAWRAWVRLESERRRLVEEEGEREAQRDYLAFVLAELDEIDPKPGEDEALEAERKRLAEGERLREAAAWCEAVLESGEENAADLLARAVRRLEEAAGWDERLSPFARQLEAALEEVRDVARSVASYGASLASDPGRLEEVEDRLAALRRLARKHGGTLEAAIARRDSLRRELEELSRAEDRLGELAEALETAAREVVRTADDLSRARREAATRLVERLLPGFGALGLEGAELEVRFEEPAGAPRIGDRAIGPRGAEEVEFFLRSNVGEDFQPLARIASGGELSRILLALKAALSSVDPVLCYVFDEVDAGIGGATALAVGRMLQEAARERQVLCITHLGQVAAFADRHLHVKKCVEGGRTVSRVEALEEEADRRRSIARMMAGTEDRSALAAAGELLAHGRRPALKAHRSHRRSRGGEAPRARMS
jgi:DNA repair protein RecN (Recombination protein N)